MTDKISVPLKEINLLQEELKPFMSFLLKTNEPWLVGGAIRDAILGLPVKDFDFVIKNGATDFAFRFAKEIKGTFVLLNAKNDEARVVYKNQKSKIKNQKEAVFDFTHMESIEDDLGRRDFRINAIAVKLPKFELFDPFGGLKDIEKKRIKMVSEKSLLEDPLRILRGFRFSATLGFKIDRETLKVLAKHTVGANGRSPLQDVAPERIHEEFFELLSAQNSYNTLQQMARLGMLQVIIPEAKLMEVVPQGKPGGSLLDHSLLTVKKVEELSTDEYVCNTPLLKLGALLHDIGKPYCYSEDEKGNVHFYGHEEKGVELLESIRERLKFSNYEFRVLQSLIRYHMRPHLLAREKTPTDKAIWRFVRDGGEEAPAILLLAYADALASGGRGRKRLIELLKRGTEMWEEMRRPKFNRLLTGDDLIELGFKPGPIFRKILEAVEEAQVSGEFRTRHEALKFVKEIANKWN